MQKAWKYRGRAVSVGEIGFIRELIATHPEAGRCALSRRLCEAWNWQQGPSATLTVPASIQTGTYVVTAARVHTDISVHSGPYIPVSATLNVLP